MTDTIDITPSPRILRMLGNIDFSAFQCLCELIDNSIDGFNFEEAHVKEPEIYVQIPSMNSPNSDKEIIVSDNGSGMNFDQLTRSLKAGFSGNNPIYKMGLFGMGFNISTARLGQKTEIITCREEDLFSYKVTIDFRELETSSKFNAPIVKVPKAADELNKHGTEIRISNLNWEHIKPLKQKVKIAKELGKTYGRIIRDKSIGLVYEGHTCRPFSHCVWNKLRTGRDGTPAIIDIDKVIDTKRYCTNCWAWLVDTDPACPSCNETFNLKIRERRVRGWIGVQRFFDKEHYGFDLIRNGRVIRSLDKELFYWMTDNDEKMFEYPRDGFNDLGRFVGELELNFVQVTHQKDAFETQSADWRDFVRVIRGDGPIQPQIAKRHNYPVNHSPLARLFSAYRTSKAGKANLVPAAPGTKRALIRDSILLDYRNRFFDNEYDYLEDDKWWQLILRGEGQINRPNAPPNGPNNPAGGNLGGPDDPTGGDPFGPEDEDEDEEGDQGGNGGGPQVKKITSSFEIDDILSGPYNIDLFKETTVRVEANRAKTGSHPNGFQVSLRGALLRFDYWPKSKIFEETFLRPEDLLVNELAYFFFLASDSRIENSPLSLVERSIKKRYFPDLQPEIVRINDEINNLTRFMKEHLRAAVKILTDFQVEHISDRSIAKVRKRMSQGNPMSPEEMEKALEKGEFMSFADLPVLVEIFEKYPQTLFDGKFFVRKILDPQKLDDVEEGLINDAQGMFKDVVWWQENGTPDSSEVWKGRSRRVVGALEVVRGWRV